jgi:DNA-binding MarR family transcriptional regulator
LSEKLNERLLESVGFLLNLFVVNEQQFPSAEGRVRYNPIDFQTLRYIENNPGCRGADIARTLGVAPTTLQSALDRLIKKGWVKRYNHPTSKRAKAHALTEDGAELRAAIHRQDLANMDVMLSALSPEEQKFAVQVLGKIAANLRQKNI